MKRLLVALLLVVSMVAVAPSMATAAPSDCQDLSSYGSTGEYRTCLVENTEKGTIMDIVDRPPAESTQKEIDAVYAVVPRHSNEFGFTEQELRKIDQWMLWEKTGISPAWYSDGTAQNLTTNLSDGAQAAFQTAGTTDPADATRNEIERVRTVLATADLSNASRQQLQSWVQTAEASSASDTDGPSANAGQIAVDQPNYRGEVQTVRENGETVYIINGTTAEIQPQNFDSDDVIGFGTTTEKGRLTYDERMDEFRFDSQGEIGSFTLFWSVEERIQTDNGTATVRTRYVATIRTDSNTTYRHITQGQLEEQRQDAANWSEWEATVRSIAGDDYSIAEATQIATNLLKVRFNPAALLTGSFTGLLLALFLQYGGWLILLLFGALHFGLRWSDIRYINREETRKAEEQDLDEKLREHEWQEKLRQLPNVDWNDHVGDYSARALRSIGETEFHGLKNLMHARRPRNLIRHRLQAMGHDGYVGVVDDDVATDGGAGGAVFADARVARADAVGDDTTTIDLTNPEDEDFETFVDALDWGSETLRNYDLTRSEASPEDITVEAAPMELEELIDSLGADAEAFNSEKEWGEHLREMVEFVRNHEFTDDTGQPDDIQMILWEWMDTDDYLADAFEIPHIKYESDALAWAVKQSDPVEAADQRVQKAQEGRDPDA